MIAIVNQRMKTLIVNQTKITVIVNLNERRMKILKVIAIVNLSSMKGIAIVNWRRMEMIVKNMNQRRMKTLIVNQNG